MEAHHREVAGMNLQKHGRVGAYGLLVIPKMGPVWWHPTSLKTAPLLVITSGMRKEPPISTNWPRLTMTSLPGRQGLQAQIHRRRVVVHHQGGFGPGELLQNAGHVDIPAAPFARLQIVFQIGVGAV